MLGLVDIGGTKLQVSVVEDGSLRNSTRNETPQVNPFDTLCEMLTSAGRGMVFDAISIGAPSPFDPSTGQFVVVQGMADEWALRWKGSKLIVELEKRFSCPIVMDNDANCAALAEAHFGAGENFNSVVYYGISTGVGGGWVINGKIHHGKNGTDFGHQVLLPRSHGGPLCSCGGYGCLEALVGGETLGRRYKRSPETIDDPGVWKEVGHWLGLAAVNATLFFGPDIIVFGGGISRRWHQFSEDLQTTVTNNLRILPPPLIQLSSLTESDRGVLGAYLILPEVVRATQSLRYP